MPDQLRARTGRLPITALVRSTAQRIRQAPLTLQRQETRGGSATEYAHFLMHRRPDALAPVEAVTTGETGDDRVLVERIVAAYRGAADDFRHDKSSMWAGFFREHHRGVHDVLLAGDVERVAEILGNPAASNLFYGFDGIGPSSSPELDPYWDYLPLFILDHLVRFAEAIGAIRLDYPEGYLQRRPRKHRADDVIEQIEQKLS